jgi:hypothetical protein
MIGMKLGPVISFLIFGYQVYLRRKQVTKQMKIAEDSLDLAKLIEAFAKLADSLEKIGPLAMSLFASMFFMVLEFLATLPSNAVKHVQSTASSTRTRDTDQMQTDYLSLQFGTRENQKNLQPRSQRGGEIVFKAHRRDGCVAIALGSV